MNNFVKLLIISLAVSTYFPCFYSYHGLDFDEEQTNKKPTIKSGVEINIEDESDIITEFGSYVAEKKINLKTPGKIKLIELNLNAPEIFLEATSIFAGLCEFNDTIYVNGAFVARETTIKNLIIMNAGNIEDLSIISECTGFKNKLNAIKEQPIVLLKGKTKIDCIEFIGDVPGIVLSSKDVVVKQIRNGTAMLYPTCNFCGKECNLARCGKCKEAYYCDRTCQSKHWNKHKNECEELSKELIERTNFYTYLTILAKTKSN